jgi:hypothetical protein
LLPCRSIPAINLSLERWTPLFGPPNAEIKLGFQALLD